MIADIKKVIPHLQDSDMEEIARQVIGKLEAMSDEEFAVRVACYLAGCPIFC